MILFKNMVKLYNDLFYLATNGDNFYIVLQGIVCVYIP